MQQLVKHTFYVFLGILLLTAGVSLVGLCYLWFWQGVETLPYLGWLLGILIAEVVGVVIMMAKKGLKYLPETESNRHEKETLQFMERFISNGTSVSIVSNRAAWLGRSDSLMEEIKEKTRQGIRFEIITPKPVSSSIRSSLEEVGVVFYVTNEDTAPDARFTLLNADHSGSEKLAIARGVHPNHEITIFDANSGPQMIGMAKDIIRKGRDLANASHMGSGSKVATGAD